MNILRAAIFAALFLSALASAARANDVTLTSRDGSLEISGTLLSFDGEFYRVDTEFGILTVDGSGVNCDGPACPTLGSYVAEFTLSGARSIGATLMPALIEGFALNGGYLLTREDRAGIGPLYRLYDKSGGTEAARITVRLTTSAEGFADLLGEQADLVLSLREATENERLLARDAGLGELHGPRQFRVIARDAMVPIVAPGNPVRRLTMDELTGIFAGEITRWSEVGGEGAPITPHLSDPQAGIGQVFATTVMRPAGKNLSETTLDHATVRGVSEAIMGDPFGIGITTYSQSALTDAVTITGACGFEVSASEASIKSGDYPLTAPVFLYMPARRLPKLARDFLAYLRSGSAQFVVRRTGYVDQSFTEVPLGAQGARLANAIVAAGPEIELAELQRMIGVFTGKRRVTLTFRFRGGSAELDAASRSNVALLAAALEAGWFDGRRLTFAGFSDGNGDAAVNRRLSERRADAVLTAVLEEAEAFDRSAVRLETDGFGEALPMACDDTDWGRRVNRRVEIWVD